jgi:hypothetical protein
MYLLYDTDINNLAYKRAGTIQIVVRHDSWFFIWQRVLPEDGALVPKHVAALCITFVLECIWLV